jgi:hypothetical protein
MAPPGPGTRQMLIDKHPPAPLDRRTLPAPAVAPLSVRAAEVRQAIRSFAPGSAGGPDGLRPQHLADMTGNGMGDSLVDVLTELVNLILAGGGFRVGQTDVLRSYPAGILQER